LLKLGRRLKIKKEQEEIWEAWEISEWEAWVEWVVWAVLEEWAEWEGWEVWVTLGVSVLRKIDLIVSSIYILEIKLPSSIFKYC
jgi:hypothetical protein